MSKHTPGPWEVTGDNGYLNQCGIGRRSAHGIDPIGAAYGAGAELEANAQLMAAAPELLEALRGMLAIEDSATQGQERELCAEWLPKARAALAKANGEGSQ